MPISTSSVFGTNPYGPTIQKTPLVQAIFGGAQAMQNFQGKQYANQQEQAKAALMQGTLNDAINATNVKNQADAQYYPQQQLLKTQQEAAMIKHIQAQTGLSYAQAREVAARTGLINTQQQMLTDPTMSFDTLYNKLQTLPEGSPQRAYTTSILNTMLNGAGMGGMPATGGKGGNKLAQLFPSAGGQAGSGMQINPLQTSRSGYRQAVTFDANGNPVTIEAPTTASGTRNQMRSEAEQEAQYIAPTVLQGVNNYQGISPTLSVLSDSLKARGKGKEAEAARQRLQQYAIASRFVPELTAINARQATGQAPGIELLREFKSSMFPNLPKEFANAFIPADIKVQAANTYPGMQREMASQAIDTARQGYVQPGMPPWAMPANPYPNGMIDASGNYVPPQAMQRPQQPQQPAVNAAQLQAMAQQAIAQGADPAAVQARLQQMLGGQNG